MSLIETTVTFIATFYFYMKSKGCPFIELSLNVVRDGAESFKRLPGRLAVLPRFRL